MKFATFLLESKHKQSITTEKAIEIAKQHCSKAIANKIELWRGGNFYDDCYLMDTSHTVRRSANTSNHYTIILDKFLGEKDLPMRSKSFIMTGEHGTSKSFGTSRRIIPFDDAKIGNTGKEDLWYVDLNSKVDMAFEDFSALYSRLDVDDKSYDQIVKDTLNLLKKLRETDEGDLDRDMEDFLKLFKDADLDIKSIELELKNIFDFDSIGFKFYTGATAPKHTIHECWLSGKALAVTDKIYDEIVKALK